LSNAQLQKKVLEELRHSFRPELINRLDEIIVFNRLSKADIGRIVELQLQELNRKLTDRHITLKIETPAKHKIADEGFDPDFGARPLRRLIQREIQDALALRLLKGDVKDGDTVTVSVDKKSGEFEFSKN
jgi:ATP-dependent Clp protease ATP-binding subunit ClpB